VTFEERKGDISRLKEEDERKKTQASRGGQPYYYSVFFRVKGKNTSRGLFNKKVSGSTRSEWVPLYRNTLLKLKKKDDIKKGGRSGS